MTEISVTDARRIFLARQGLLRRDAFGRGKGAILRAIEQLGYVQIDTISVVDRAHHHVPGRVDAKVVRDKGELVIKSLYLEPGIKPGQRLREALSDGFNEFAARNLCGSVRLEKTVHL